MNTSIANATFFATMAPIWGVILVWLVLKQRVSRTTLVGLGLFVVGGTKLMAQSLGLAPARPVGDAMADGSGG